MNLPEYRWNFADVATLSAMDFQPCLAGKLARALQLAPAMKEKASRLEGFNLCGP
jgi:hypothetical protein